MKNLIASLLVLLTAVSCGGDEGSNYLEESGTIEAVNVLISSKTGGEIAAKYFDEGDFVNAGDTLLILDTTKYALKVKQAKAAKSAAEAKLNLMKKGARSEDLNAAMELLNQAKANLERAEKDKERFEDLIKSGSITRKQYDDVSTGYQIALSQYNAAREKYKKLKRLFRKEEITEAEANLTNAESVFELAVSSLNDCYVISPAKGTIVKSYMEKGENAMPGTSLFKISDLTNMEIVVYVSEEKLGKVKLGASADVFVDSFPDKSFAGKVVFISPESEFTPKNIQTKDERTKLVFGVKLKVDNPEGLLKSGVPADVKINLN